MKVGVLTETSRWFLENFCKEKMRLCKNVFLLRMTVGRGIVHPAKTGEKMCLFRKNPLHFPGKDVTLQADNLIMGVAKFVETPEGDLRRKEKFQ